MYVTRCLTRKTNTYWQLKSTEMTATAISKRLARLRVIWTNNPIGTQNLGMVNQQRRAVPKIFPHAVKTLVKRKPAPDLVTPAAPKKAPSPAPTPESIIAILGGAIRSYRAAYRAGPNKPSWQCPYRCFPFARRSLDPD